MTSMPAPPVSQSLTDRQKRETEYYNAYSRINAPQKVDFAPVLSKARRPWSPHWYTCGLVRDAYSSPDQRLLDFGCGMGVSGITFARLGYKVDGFDISPGNIEVASQLAARYELGDRCNFTTMTAETLEYPDNHFDVVAGMDILHHVDIPVVMKEVHRVLKPGGIAIFKEPVRVPLLDSIRECRLLRAIAPTETSMDKHVHITDDERKLERADIEILENQFSEVRTRRFSVLLRLYRVIPDRWFSLVWKLQRMDYEMMRFCPPLRKLGDVCVFTCVK